MWKSFPNFSRYFGPGDTIQTPIFLLLKILDILVFDLPALFDLGCNKLFELFEKFTSFTFEFDAQEFESILNNGRRIGKVFPLYSEIIGGILYILSIIAKQTTNINKLSLLD